MSHMSDTPFASIEGTHEYIELLLEAIEETQKEVDADIATALRNRAVRREQGLRMVAHKLHSLSFHVTRSRRLLNDLRTLRRLLLEERSFEKPGKIARAAGAE